MGLLIRNGEIVTGEGQGMRRLSGRRGRMRRRRPRGGLAYKFGDQQRHDAHGEI